MVRVSLIGPFSHYNKYQDFEDNIASYCLVSFLDFENNQVLQWLFGSNIRQEKLFNNIDLWHFKNRLLIVAIERRSVASSSCIEMASWVDGIRIPDDGFCWYHGYGLVAYSRQKYRVSWKIKKTKDVSGVVYTMW